jgi:ACS family hexuronate transporter-like MFS transporter
MPTADQASAAATAPGTGGPLPLQYDPSAGQKVGSYRWVICALLFFGTTINYVDRQVLNFLGPHLDHDLGIGDKAFGKITSAFALSYAIGQTFAGRWLDYIGTRIGYALSLTLWSIASMSHAFVRTAMGFSIARILLGIAESPCYPANNKTTAEWFPKRERATVMGFINAGTNLGVVIAAALATPLYMHFKFTGVFLFTGGLGFVWLAFWLPIYRKPHEHPRVSARELAHITSDPEEGVGKIRWLRLIAFRQTWAFAASKFITDAIWYFFIVWTAKFLAGKPHHIDIKNLGLPFIVIYTMADVGSIAGGWLSSSLIKRGMTINRARKMAMFFCICCILPVMSASKVPSAWAAVILLGFATAGHQGFSANQYAIVSDMFPKRAVGSVSGFGGTWGYLGGSLWSLCCGVILDRNGSNYTPLMIVAGLAYLVAFSLIQGLAPHLEPAKLDEPSPRGFEVSPPSA